MMAPPKFPNIEEIKKSQYIMNNAINEIKNTLEGTNCRITEAERHSQAKDNALCVCMCVRAHVVGVCVWGLGVHGLFVGGG